MTNLTIVLVLSTNWITTSVEYPYPLPGEGQRDWRDSSERVKVTYHQFGTIQTNTIAIIDWNGIKTNLVLKSIQERYGPSCYKKEDGEELIFQSGRVK